jgi:hypothetical protein
MAKEAGLKCEVLDEAKMEKLGMGSLISVSHRIGTAGKIDRPPLRTEKSTAKKASFWLWSEKASRSIPAEFRSSPAKEWTR